MATSWERNKNNTRPKKSEADKRRRLKAQKARLLKLGVPAAKVAKLDAVTARALLRRPAKLAPKA